MNPVAAPESAAGRARASQVRGALPPGGLFAGHEWRISPNAFSLGPDLAKNFESLGRVLLQFYRAVNLLYRQSVSGRQPGWIAQLLDQGKPDELVALQRSDAFKNALPRVIRPDVLLTDSGYAITELDSVPGGIGLTAWLNQTYAGGGMAAQVIGGPDGMLSGFRSIFGKAAPVYIVVSEEAATYRPEMEWLCQQLGAENYRVVDAAFTAFPEGAAVYRFFELFDLNNVPAANALFAQAASRALSLTPPPKPLFEEKMLFALLWNRNLREFWRQHLGEGFFNRMLQITPYTWVLDPSPLPPHAALPELNLTSWQQLKNLSQRERELILKVSGYSEEAWGARGVYLGSDLSQGEWSLAIDKALDAFPRSPYVLQRYHKPRTIPMDWFDFSHEKLATMNGRVRLCPYYFVTGEGDHARPVLGGVLATICPADKKIIHGMRDAILAPAQV